jgi:hypothetical protein
MPKFNVESNKIRVSDPGYDKDIWCNFTTKAKNGEWKCYASHLDLDGWGHRIGSIIAEHNKPGKIYKIVTHTIGVDSGQAGIFDDKYYKDNDIIKNTKRIHNQSICEDEPWYSICCDRTLSKNQWGTIPYGVVSSSGLGDGCYETKVYLNKKNEAVKIEINFFSEEMLQNIN